ncbi:MAG: hypothetical protein FGM27_01900 [Candidatus Omnitrophica bacterium]|nr:hypothetical protein [Candidatus Omnitrophota bacterium]
MRRRFNLFAFAPEPSGRLILFWLSALMLAVHLGLFFRYALTPEADLASPFLQASRNLSAFSGPALFEAFHDEFWRVSNGTVQSLGLPVFFAAILALAALGAGSGKTSDEGGVSRRFAWHEDPAFVEAIERLAERAGVEAPELWEGDDPDAQGVRTLRRRGKTALLFYPGSRVLFRKQKEVIESAVLHELSHEPHRSLAAAYRVRSLWESAKSLTPFAVLLAAALIVLRSAGVQDGFSRITDGRFLKGALPLLLLFLFQTLGSLMVMRVLKSGYFRSRALWADARAAAAGGSAGLMKLLNQAKLPFSRERKESLEHPELLFRPNLDLPFWTGMLCAFTSGSVMLLLMPVAMGISTALLNFGAKLAEMAKASQDDVFAILLILTVSLIFLIQLLMAILLVLMPLASAGYLAAKTFGRQIQRASAADAAEGASSRGGYGKLWPYAALAAAGIEAGFFFTPYALYFPRTFKSALFLIPWFAAVTELTWLCLSASRYLTLRFVGRHTGSSAPSLQGSSVTAAVSLLFAAVYGPLFAARALILSHAEGMSSVEMLLFLLGAAGFAAAGFAAVFLGAWFFLGFKFSGTPPRCPSCGQSVSRQGNLLKALCAQCGCRLAPWANLEELPQEDSGPQSSGSRG